jgi:hypothetical protein
MVLLNTFIAARLILSTITVVGVILHSAILCIHEEELEAYARQVQVHVLFLTCCYPYQQSSALWQVANLVVFGTLKYMDATSEQLAKNEYNVCSQDPRPNNFLCPHPL